MQRLRNNSRNCRRVEPLARTFQQLHHDGAQRYDVSDSPHCRNIRKLHHLFVDDMVVYSIRHAEHKEGLLSHLWSIYDKAVTLKPKRNPQRHSGLEASSNPQ